MSYRIAAIGDLHIFGRVPQSLYHEFESLADRADVLVIAGDITNNGMLKQAELASDLLRQTSLPIVAVMGNHDRRALHRKSRYCEILGQAGVTFLDGNTFVLGGASGVGFAGVSGSGGGFWPDEGPDTLPRRAAQRLAVRARTEARRLEEALASLDTRFKVAVTHVAPTMTTLHGEPKFKFWLLGNSEFGRVIDRYDVDLVVHGHAHRGNHRGTTSRGIPVLNVAQSVSRRIVVHELPSDTVSAPRPVSTLVEARV